MSNWYLIGRGSSYNADMNFSEICVDYFNRGNETDRSAFYHFYIGIAQKYFGEFETEFLSKSEAVLEYYKGDFNSKNVYIPSGYKIFDEFRQKYTLDELKLIFRDSVSAVEEAYKSKNDKLDRYIFDVFNILSGLFCFNKDLNKTPVYLDDIRGDNLNIGVIANTTGWFAFNSYMFAYVNSVHLIGVPTLPSEFDDDEGCSRVFMIHDLAHTFKIKDKHGTLDKTRQIYELIMLGDYSKQIKEILIFSLWYQIHETSSNPINITMYPYEFSFFVSQKEFLIFTGVFDHIDSEVRKDILNHYEEIFGWLSQIDGFIKDMKNGSPTFYQQTLIHTVKGHLYPLYIEDIKYGRRNFKQYLEDANNDDDPQMRFKIIYMYGCYLLYDLIKKVRE